MTEYPLDIIIPVWNSPVEVRAALASFAADSPMARLVMVNNGSERETEAILHEFAEALDDRALLLSTGKNIGTVAALNLGLAKSSAPFALLTNPFVRMTHGWFDSVQSVFDRSMDAGAVYLRCSQGVNVEADHGSFVTMVLKRELFPRTAVFDEQMDGAVWALRDFARRATASGYKTFSVGSRQLRFEQQQELGSLAKREQRVREARQLYVERWGEPAGYLLVCSDQPPCESIAVFRETLLEAARQGDTVTVIAANSLGKELLEAEFAALHDNISLLVLPRFFAARALRRAVDGIVSANAATLIIAADETAPSPLNSLSFADFSATVSSRRERYYHGGVHA